MNLDQKFNFNFEVGEPKQKNNIVIFFLSSKEKKKDDLLTFPEALKNNKAFEEQNINLFYEEIDDLGIKNPTIVAFGGDAYSILNRNFKNKFKITKIRHYSDFKSKEYYKKEVKCILNF